MGRKLPQGVVVMPFARRGQGCCDIPRGAAHFVKIRAPLFLWAQATRILLYWTPRALEKVQRRQKVMAGM